MKSIKALLLFLMPLSLMAQDVDTISLPLVDGVVLYEKVYVVDANLKGDDLYIRSLKWFAGSFVDSKEVLQLSDKSSGKIIGKGYFKTPSKGFAGLGYNVEFVVEINVKDGKYKFQSYNYKRQAIGGSTLGDFVPIEPSWQRYKKGEGKFYRKDDTRFFVSMDRITKDLMLSLFETMNKQKKDNDF